ncbi:alpha/beta fold hydrolase [Paenibacillus monticola]|uniref:Alpha/beta fold hydrolase n=1 Tax=Paenibacillus monticola TaxID=2666075 RepID=A0A7X2L3L4_9BACL|nr:alpha/beta hydrolase [Paenibacillus monticola]MRN55435.1 alpha/beta fold hydrolase [Paenibacillus monticola]
MKSKVSGLMFLVVILIVSMFASIAGAETSTVGTTGKYDLGDYSLYANIQGVSNGKPTVIFESGYGDDSSIWAGIQSVVAQHTLTVSYDRAGLGQSDNVSENKKDAKDQVKALHKLLNRAHIPGPYIIVAHSIGGTNARVYADRYGEDVAGIVFVDSSFENQEEALYEALHEAFPDPVDYDAFIAAYTGQFTVEGSHETVLESLNQAADTVKHDPLRNIPISVITASQEQISEAFKSVWFGFHATLASYSDFSKSVTAENSGHYVMLSEPQLVINEILNLLN